MIRISQQGHYIVLSIECRLTEIFLDFARFFGLQFVECIKGRIKDTFEVALLNAETMISLAGTADGLNNIDAFLNIRPSGQTYFGSQVLVLGLGASGEILSLTEPIVVGIDLTGIPVGTVATLYFDLLGFGDDGDALLTGSSRIGHLQPYELDTTADESTYSTVNVLSVPPLKKVEDLNQSMQLDVEGNAIIIDILFSTDRLVHVNLLLGENDSESSDVVLRTLLRFLVN